MRGSDHISLGNQSISNRRTSHGWLTATGAALVGDREPAAKILPDMDSEP
ncbi:hypothetical protein GCM10027199_79070 [Amycolatopsis magusensis]